MSVCISIYISISVYLLGLENDGLHVWRHALAAVGGEPVAEHTYMDIDLCTYIYIYIYIYTYIYRYICIYR